MTDAPPKQTRKRTAPRTPKAAVVPVVRRKMDELVPDPGNVRKHSESQITALQGSLRRWGQPKPILIDSKDVIVAGNGLYEAARREGWDWIETRLFKGTPAEARAYGIADNRLAELSTWDIELLTETLRTFDDDTRLDLGWKPDELDKYLTDELGNGGDAPEEVDQHIWGVVVNCENEQQQTRLLEQLSAEGFDVRAIL